MSENCLFCKIVKKEIPASIVYEDEHILSFKDINPKADLHLLVIPKVHFENFYDFKKEHDAVMLHLIHRIPIIAKDNGALDGFRTIFNTGSAGGQEVFHIHAHILAGKNKFPGF